MHASASVAERPLVGSSQKKTSSSPRREEAAPFDRIVGSCSKLWDGRKSIGSSPDLEDRKQLAVPNRRLIQKHCWCEKALACRQGDTETKVLNLHSRVSMMHAEQSMIEKERNTFQVGHPGIL